MDLFGFDFSAPQKIEQVMEREIGGEVREVWLELEKWCGGMRGDWEKALGELVTGSKVQSVARGRRGRDGVRVDPEEVGDVQAGA